MSESFPSFVKGDSLDTRDGLQEAEFNKALQAGGFRRERDRRVDAPAKNSDPLGAGTYLFSNCEWRDPTNETEIHDLVKGFQRLVQSYPAAGKSCSCERFLEVVAKFHAGWKPNAGRARKKQKTLEMGCDDDTMSVSSKCSAQSMQDVRMGASDLKPGSKLGTPFGNGVNFHLNPSRGPSTPTGVSDLSRNPLNIATLGDMWTFHGDECTRTEAMPFMGSNSMLSMGMQQHAACASDLDIGLGQGARRSHNNNNSDLSPGVGGLLRVPMTGSLGKRERDNTQTLFDQMSQLCVRNSSHAASPASGRQQNAHASSSARSELSWRRNEAHTFNSQQQHHSLVPHNGGGAGLGVFTSVLNLGGVNLTLAGGMGGLSLGGQLQQPHHGIHNTAASLQQHTLALPSSLAMGAQQHGLSLQHTPAHCNTAHSRSGELQQQGASLQHTVAHSSTAHSRSAELEQHEARHSATQHEARHGLSLSTTELLQQNLRQRDMLTQRLLMEQSQTASQVQQRHHSFLPSQHPGGGSLSSSMHQQHLGGVVSLPSSLQQQSQQLLSQTMLYHHNTLQSTAGDGRAALSAAGQGGGGGGGWGQTPQHGLLRSEGMTSQSAGMVALQQRPNTLQQQGNTPQHCPHTAAHR